MTLLRVVVINKREVFAQSDGPVYMKRVKVSTEFHMYSGNVWNLSRYIWLYLLRNVSYTRC
jgi:hypothetical protein